ncbi:GIY-YIG nuclease family protein [Speluncibacter jeojiensis]|uniref:GIY-YIG nuclease family protein n=1 Tax=Speluncibacter jeojiensis TaxID=2710754 RepID=A0A9X4RC79_9ACTN|nr:GIY-YIG nuclease family protein [Corynebacteriales bacterium D3-21]
MGIECDSTEERAYRFAGVPLTPSVFAELISLLASGQQVRRSDLITLVSRHHAVNGGLPANGKATSVAKKALQTLSRTGRAEQTGCYGLWRIAGIANADADFALPEPEVEPSDEAASAQFVYAYYLPAYGALAQHQGATVWPHKIGMTTVSVKDRIASQVGTALPEHPVVVLAHEAEDAALLEAAVHSILELRGQRISGAPGSEWFSTNADEVRAIIDWCIAGVRVTPA